MRRILCGVLLCLVLLFQPAWADVHILSINDFHGWIEESGSSVGMAKLAAFITRYAAEHPDTIVVSGGDNYQGEALSNLSRGGVVNDIYRHIGLEISAVGNHELDWGTDLFDQWGKTGVQYLAANILDTGTGAPISWAKPYRIVRAGDKRIAFIGLSTRETSGSTASKNLEGLRFEDAAVAAARWITYLKQESDKDGPPDAIILLTHIPSFQEPLTGMITGDELSTLTRLKGVDAVITGHSHQLVAGRMGGVPVIQAACFGKAAGILHVQFDEKGLSGIMPEVVVLKDIAASLPNDPSVLAVRDDYRRRLSGIIDRKVCRLKQDLPFEHHAADRETPLGYLICEAVRSQTGTQIALVNNGAIRRGLAAGEVTYGHIMGVFPFDDYVVTMRISGKDLREVVGNAYAGKKVRPCQYAGLSLMIHRTLIGGPAVDINLANGDELKDDAYYTLAVPDYIYEGGDGYAFQNARDTRYIYVQLRDMLAEYLTVRREITAPDVRGVFHSSLF